MKRIIAITALLFTLTATTSAMSYEQAREQALFLTDKMAYELNLTEEQYDAAYEVNLDYLMSVNTPDDLYEAYWRQRNLDLSYILLDWQYRAFCAAAYFYRPLYWTSGVWHFAVYSRYPRRHYLYFGHTNIYLTYRGGHSWRHNGERSWYKGRTFHHGHGSKWNGMKDRFDRGEFHHGDRKRPGTHTGRDNRVNNMHGNRHAGTPVKMQNNNNKLTQKYNFKGNRGSTRSHRESSTRTTARPNKGANFGKNAQKRPSNIFTPKRSNQHTTINRNTGTRKSFSGGNRNSGGRNRQSGGNKGGGHGGNFGGKR